MHFFFIFLFLNAPEKRTPVELNARNYNLACPETTILPVGFNLTSTNPAILCVLQ